MDYNEKQELLISKIADQTEQRRLAWKTDAEDTSFSAVLSPKYVVRASWPHDTAYLIVLDSEGREIFKFSETQQDPLRGVMSIWVAARRNALGLDKALDELLEELN